MIATGGGSADRSIYLWNSLNGSVIQSVEAASPITSLHWGPHVWGELISTHGSPSNDIIIWKAPFLTQVASLKGHSGRILDSVFSPGKQRLVTVGADENLQFRAIYSTENKNSSTIAANNSSGVQLLPDNRAKTEAVSSPHSSPFRAQPLRNKATSERASPKNVSVPCASIFSPQSRKTLFGAFENRQHATIDNGPAFQISLPRITVTPSIQRHAIIL